MSAATHSLRRRDTVEGWLFIAPALFGFLLFMVYPILASSAISLFDWNLTGKPAFSGLRNYRALWGDEVFRISLLNTCKWVVVYVPVSIVASLVLALAMDMPIRGIIGFRTIFYLPVVSPVLVVALLFVWLYNSEFGLFNYLLSLAGLEPVGWLTNPRISIFSVAAMYMWKDAGYNMLIILAALQGIPRQLYEAAELDGVTGLRKLLYIKLPLLTPAFYYVIIVSVIYAFQVFTEIYIMTNGGPGYSTHTIAYYLWVNAFRYGKMGYACAQAMVLFVLIMGVTLVQDRLLGRKVQYDL
ncbi:MAG TPA: sugar ABC transporter permease [Spirochaetales bacterium]|nr:sugar ABC transporter permease [Spirochaetales bacterium]HRY56073.1 sugar ABC transporter permease [Spirochaetia bacterium]HRZ64027.1 sugar ABC transporter permease [Spirochaetia bacterium]